ncbi:hypothetical protein ACFLTW_00180 [Chloroflexota bacterium]
MKRTLIILVAVVAIIGILAGSGLVTGASSGASPVLTVANPVSEMGDTVVILGSGYEPGQTVNIVLNTGDSKIDIAYALTGEASPVANERGAFVTAFTPGRIASRVLAAKRGGPSTGAYSFAATDEDYVAMATTPIAFWEAAPEGEELPGWAQ